MLGMKIEIIGDTHEEIMEHLQEIIEHCNTHKETPTACNWAAGFGEHGSSEFDILELDKISFSYSMMKKERKKLLDKNS